MSKETLDILIPIIKKFEGCKLKAYKCPAGKWTIGYGQTGKEIVEGLVWTHSQADDALWDTAEKCLEQALYASPSLKLTTPKRQAAIADFIYNLGTGNYNKSTLKGYIDTGLWAMAKKEILKWDKAGGKKLAGLTARREAESALIG